MKPFIKSYSAKGLIPALADGLERWSSNAYLRAVQRGMLFALPLIFLGAISLCLLNFPSTAVTALLNSLFGSGWSLVLEKIVQGAFGIASLAVVIATAYSIAYFENASTGDKFVSPAMNTMVALSCYIILVGSPADWESQFSLDKGLFLAVTTAVLVSFIFLRLASWRRIRLSFTFIGRDPTTFQVLTLIPAATATIFIFAIAQVGYEKLFPEGIAVSNVFIHLLFSENSGGLGLGVLYVGVSQLLWFVGIHGPNMLFSLEQGTLSVAMQENIQAALVHAAPPHIMTKGFLDAFAYMGGSGATLSLILAVLLKSRDTGNRRLCFFALFPALCNVNEPLLFGIPLVFNPLYAVPFLLTPLLDLCMGYAATALDWVPRTISNVHWTAPALLSGYITTGSLAGTLLQMVNLCVGALLYLPFVMLSDKIHERQLQGSLKTLAHYADDALPGPNGKKCLTRTGPEGFLAHMLAEDLLNALKQQKQLFLVYQPQVNTLTNRVEGVECLLRWKHPVYGFIPPPVAVALAEDCGLIDALGLFVLQNACAAFLEWKHAIDDDFLISVNLSAKQLDNPHLVDSIVETLAASGTPANHLEVEITESVAVTPNDATYETLSRLRSLGIQVAIDDFGMGHTSLRYIKEFPIDTVKLDKSLTEETQNGVNDHIVRSLMYLSQNLCLRTVVEGVEQNDQCEHFKSLGCFIFQGYYFSTPLTCNECFNFITLYGNTGKAAGNQDMMPNTKNSPLSHTGHK